MPGTASNPPSPRPLVVVLMATHNGASFLAEQAATILGQADVDVRLVVSDDASTDGTDRLLAELAQDPRVQVLPRGRFGTPQANFLRLIDEADVTGADAIALADQDDLWHSDKLARQLEQLRAHGRAAVSSNVTAFWRDEDGERRKLIDKAQPQRMLDFLMEAAGPGCSYVLEPTAFATIREVLRSSDRIDPRVAHDWLIYAIARSLELPWHIDPRPTIDYRQHGANATGANSGFRQALVRFRRLASGDYRAQVVAVTRLCQSIATDRQREPLTRILPLLERSTIAHRAALRRRSHLLRRSAADRRLLRAALLLGAW